MSGQRERKRTPDNAGAGRRDYNNAAGNENRGTEILREKKTSSPADVPDRLTAGRQNSENGNRQTAPHASAGVRIENRNSAQRRPQPSGPRKSAGRKKGWARYAVPAAAATVFLAVFLTTVCLHLQNTGADFPVYIDEVLASNSRWPDENGRCLDYIEVYNSSAAEISLTGYQLAQKGSSGSYVFPAGTKIPAGGYIAVSCAAGNTDNCAPFAVSNDGGEVFQLLTKRGGVLSEVETASAAGNESQYFDAEGQRTVGSPSPGCAEGEAVDGASYANTGVEISEYMASNSSWPGPSGTCSDWVEIRNTGDTQVDISGWSLTPKLQTGGYVFPEGTALAPHACLAVYSGDGDDMLPFGISRYGGETVFLLTSDGRIADYVDTEPLETDASMVLTENGWEQTMLCSPGYEAGNANENAGGETAAGTVCTVVISEAMGSNYAVIADSTGSFGDWLELCNTGSAAVNLGGWHLSDDPDDPEKWELPAVSLNPDSYLLVWCGTSEDASETELHADFSLSALGETLTLTNPTGTASSVFVLGSSDGVHSWALSPEDGTVAQAEPTPGYANTEEGFAAWSRSCTPNGPLIIREYMAANDSVLRQAFGKCYDWVEIANISSENVQLSDYSLAKDMEGTLAYVLPEMELEPGACILIMCSGDTGLTTEAYLHAGFKLSAEGDSLFLLRADGTVADYAAVLSDSAELSRVRADGCGAFADAKPTPGE